MVPIDSQHQVRRRRGESLDYVVAAIRANTQPPHTQGLGYVLDRHLRRRRVRCVRTGRRIGQISFFAWYRPLTSWLYAYMVCSIGFRHCKIVWRASSELYVEI